MAQPPAAPVDWLIFSRQFQLAGSPSSATLHVFASTRYRLRINGNIIGYGPGRFVPGHEEFDTYDIAPHLGPHINVILVEACFINANNFQSMPGDRGRFIAWGTVHCPTAAIDLDTPGLWQVQRSTAWRQDSPHFSFAIGPAEILDLAAWRRIVAPDAPWQPPLPLPHPTLLGPRTLPMPTGKIIDPILLHAGSVIRNEQRIGFNSLDIPQHQPAGSPLPPRHFCYATFLLSPRQQQTTLGLHWGPHFLNGCQITGSNDPARGNRQNATVQLNHGWNLLCGQPRQIQPAYPLLVGLPLAANLIAKASPTLSTPHALRYQLPCAIEDGPNWNASPPTAHTLNLDDPTWRFVSAESLPPCPARMISWDQPEPMAHQPSSPLPLRLPTDKDFTAIFDFGAEYLGHVIVDLEAPAGTVVDLAYDERLRPDGSLDLFACNPFVESADRWISPGRRETFETFHPRGGRYVQLTIRPSPQSAGQIVLHALALRDARCLPSCTGAFHCDRELFNWTWDVGAQTVQAGTEEVFCDSPWRERGLYLGDAYVQSMVHMALCHDHAVVRRALRLFAQAQHPNGQMPGAAPAWLPTIWGDYTLIYALWLRDYWARTGDADALRLGLPAIDRLLASPTWKTSPYSILWDVAAPYVQFIDWGALEDARQYDENGTLNALRYQALTCAAQLHQATHNHTQAHSYLRQAAHVAQAFRQRLWISDAGRFAGGFAGSRQVTRDILHVNILALAFGLADPAQEPALIRYVLQRLETNAVHAAQGRPADDFAELYFLQYVLTALVRIERFDAAERVIADHMKIMKDHHAWTFWECLHRGIGQKGSLCHAWSTAPLDYFTRYVLGVREKSAGRPDHLVVHPRVAAIHQACGTVPHPAGPISVQWRRSDHGRLEITAHGPPTVRLDLVQ